LSSFYALELYSGIGGFAMAAKDRGFEILALDQNPNAIDTYKLNFPHHKCQRYNLEKFNTDFFTQNVVDFLWLSPPCQPYTQKGKKEDLDDNRATSLKNIIAVLSSLKSELSPTHIALENVVGFKDSNSRILFLDMLKTTGYNIKEHTICPTQIGIPSRRERHYILASKKGLKDFDFKKVAYKLEDFIGKNLKGYPKDELFIKEEILKRFSDGMRIIDSKESDAYTTCFGSGYYKSYKNSGSFLFEEREVRRFTPEEMCSLLGFGEDFRFPKNLDVSKRWKLAGNSVSVFVVKRLIDTFNLE